MKDTDRYALMMLVMIENVSLAPNSLVEVAFSLNSEQT